MGLMETNENNRRKQYAAAIEALLYVSGDPLTIGDLAQIMEISEEEADAAVSYLIASLEEGDRGLGVVRFAEKVQMCTKPEFASYIDRMGEPLRKQTLSQAALETLSIIAYRQPITRNEIEQIRGVRCEYVVSSLMTKGLIREVGRKESIGRPILFGTTDLFLRHFSLEDLSDLPNREELVPDEMTV